ncbi:MAG TPA: energy transducer TonB [Bacteroidales bacterium]|nr:energy transducer TonB [Bacteroidales bacterium]
MKKELNRIPDFDDIIFEIRNKEYGAYSLRKRYKSTVLISMLIGVVIMAITIIAPYFNAMALEDRHKRAERQVEINMENLDQPNETVVPPPPPPPPPSDVVQQVKYIPPVVVDSVKPDDTVQLMTADEAQIEVKNDEVIDIISEVKEEVQEDDAEPEPFIVVEEMPVPPGGVTGLLKYIAENINYPEIARENNIQGKVIVRFCVTSKGGVDQVSIYKGVDQELDAEAIRVVKTLPPFKPGRQGGKPVPVWFSVPISFEIK